LTRKRTAFALGAAALVVAAPVTWRELGRHDSTGPASGAELAAASAGLPGPERPAFVPGKPVPLRRDETRARFAPVLHDADAHAQPSPSSPVLANLARGTPEETTNIVLVLGEATGAGRQWVHVRLPVLPNNETAWVPRSELGGYQFVHTKLVVDREHFTATLFYDGRVVFRAPVGVGKPGAPTPRGNFYVRDKVSGFGDPFYGPIAYGTSARSEVLTDWPGGGFVGIHGTNEPQLIPGRISHGCIRLRNADIRRLSLLMPVGTPLVIR
jgi:lipoprotein-anchoring transpeptidase ErfK/SrfK